MCSPYSGIISRQNSGVFAEIQMQQRTGVVVTRTQRLGQRNHPWRREEKDF